MDNEAYLLMWGESGDEVHINLITKEGYKIIKDLIDSMNGDRRHDINIEDELQEVIERDDITIKRWFTQTYCTKDWPYRDWKILGTVSLPKM